LTSVTNGAEGSATPLLSARGLVKHYAIRRGALQRTVGAARAVDGVDLDVFPGECLALVGESGCGKTTLGRLVTRLVEPDAGTLTFAGEDFLALRGAALRRKRREIQVVFQDPWSSLNPRLSIGEAIREPIAVHRLAPRGEQGARVAELLGMVGLDAELASRYPHELSGGQRQRVGIARALATGPRLIVADEPVSGARRLGARADREPARRAAARLGLAMLFIAHDLALVEQLADRVAVMYLGRIVELGPCADVLARPQHPYTVGLLEAVPVPDPGRRPAASVAGEPPSPVSPAGGVPVSSAVSDRHRSLRYRRAGVEAGWAVGKRPGGLSLRGRTETFGRPRRRDRQSWSRRRPYQRPWKVIRSVRWRSGRSLGHGVRGLGAGSAPGRFRRRWPPRPC
jgi:oligopeptide/dipeptide ABC transporter ATP-binding protein